MSKDLGINVLILGVVIFSLGIISYLTNDSIEIANTIKQTSITERDIAIAEAKKKGLKEYSFTTNFIPGIGVISDPSAYKKSWEEQQEKELN